MAEVLYSKGMKTTDDIYREIIGLVSNQGPHFMVNKPEKDDRLQDLETMARRRKAKHPEEIGPGLEESANALFSSINPRPALLALDKEDWKKFKAGDLTKSSLTEDEPEEPEPEPKK